MSGADLSALRTGLRDHIAAAIPDLNVYDFLPAKGGVQMPCVVVADDDPFVEVQSSSSQAATFGPLGDDGFGISLAHFRLYVIVADTIDRSAQMALDQLCSFGKGNEARSVPAALGSFPGLCVQSVSGMRMLTFNLTQAYAGREIHCYVTLDRSAP